MADIRREIGHTVEELAYAAVGFAVLGFQRAQVARRSLERCDPVAAFSTHLRSVFSASSDGEREKPDEHGDG